MEKNNIEKLHELTEFAYQYAKKQDAIDAKWLLVTAANVFDRTSLAYRVREEDAIDFVKLACRDVILLLEMLYDYLTYTGDGARGLRYTIPGYKYVGFTDTISVIAGSETLELNPYLKETFEFMASSSVNNHQMEVFKRLECLRIAGNVFEWADGVPRERIKRCRENDDDKGKCNRVFIQQTARERMFCSDYCKNKFNIRQRAKTNAATTKEED